MRIRFPGVLLGKADLEALTDPSNEHFLKSFIYSVFQTNEWNKNDERLLAAVEHGEVDKVTSLLAKKGSSAVKLDSEGKSA
uniref:Uncharacterized protein n=1 Tax=Neogobius melanostomus TaxID=47308 RepID=A0A8C6UB25_9GOBI